MDLVTKAYLERSENEITLARALLRISQEKEAKLLGH